MNWVLAGLLSVVLVEIVSSLPVAAILRRASRAAGRAFRVLSAPAISDHWKEKVLPAYAAQLFGAALRLGALLAGVAAIAWGLVLAGNGLAPGFADFIAGTAGIAATLIIATAWFLIRRRKGAAEAPAYGPGARLLHRLVLGNRAVAGLLLDIETALARPDAEAAGVGRHVFVAGLARAGTTILMRRLHATGAFRSLTYRDMPFVLAPGLWSRLSGPMQRESASRERAHGDGIMVDGDSPESFDEAFWRLFEGEAYIRADRLLPHRPAEETLKAYRSYVGAILASGGRRRYLCKNNNNILRLPALARTFPNALILVPFREPLSHAASLRAQHERFVASQAEDPFEVEYMGYLGHHEFGRDHRPFRTGEAPAAPGADPGTLDYWLGLWIEVYAHLLAELPANARLVCYEDLCQTPTTWQAVAREAGIGPEAPGAASFQLRRHAGGGADPALRGRAEALYARMRQQAIGRDAPAGRVTQAPPTEGSG
ncbi:sulfotransferase [Rhodobacteraceae bacterium NNCM2]|nr:sulfotransferase [Coraliihabitans acroporae]